MDGETHAWRTSAAPHARGIDNGFELQVDPEMQLAYALQRVPLSGSRRLRVSGKVRTSEFDAKAEKPSRVRIVAVSLDEDGTSLYRRPHEVVRVKHNGDWVEFEKVIRIWRDIDTVDFGVHLHGTSGRATLRDLKLVPVEEAGWFGLVRKLLLSSWLVFLAAGAHRLWRTTPASLARLALFTMLVGTLLGCCLPAPWSQSLYRGIQHVTDEAQDWFTQVAESLPGSTEPGVFEQDEARTIPSPGLADSSSFFLIKRIVKKSGHFIFFALLALSFAWARSHDHRRVVAFGLEMGVTTELLQFFCFARMPGVFDVGIDLAGTLVGYGLYRAIVALRSSRKLPLRRIPGGAQQARDRSRAA